jgi:hypothetical protein
MSYIILRGHWFHIIILNIHGPTEDKTGDLKDSFCADLERVFENGAEMNILTRKE